MGQEHHYSVAVVWVGNTGRGTDSYVGYERAHEIRCDQKPAISGSSDPAFRGDPTRYNPEELFVAALSSCHMLWYLHLCAESGIVVVSYNDNAKGTMIETTEGGTVHERHTSSHRKSDPFGGTRPGPAQAGSQTLFSGEFGEFSRRTLP